MCYQRYDLLINRFLTSKQLVRSSAERPVVRYVRQEAATQRARRAAALLMWLREHQRPSGRAIPLSELQSRASELVTAWQQPIVMDAGEGSGQQPIVVDVADAASELQRLGLVRATRDAERATASDGDGLGVIGERESEGGGRLDGSSLELRSDQEVVAALQAHWATILVTQVT